MNRTKGNIASLMFLLCTLAGEGQEGMVFPGKNLSVYYDSLGKIRAGMVISMYHQATGIKREFVNGKEYFPYYFRSKSNPMLRFDEPRSAILTYKDRTYQHLALQYDTFTDEVVYSDDRLIFNNRVCPVSLNKDLASRFELCFGHDTLHFRYFIKSRDPGFTLPDGYYEVAHDRKTQYLIRHISTSYRTVDRTTEYIYKPVNYIRTGNDFSEITTGKKFIAQFGNRSEEIRHFLRQKRISIRKADKKQIKEVLDFYEALPVTDI